MTKISFAAAEWGFGASKPAVTSRPYFNQDAFSRRMDRFGARREGGRTGAITSSPQHLDARLLEDGEALEAAWQWELRALIASRRLKTPEAEAAASVAQTACATIVRRIRNLARPDARRPEGAGAGRAVAPRRRTVRPERSGQSGRRLRVDGHGGIAAIRRGHDGRAAAGGVPWVRFGTHQRCAARSRAVFQVMSLSARSSQSKVLPYGGWNSPTAFQRA